MPLSETKTSGRVAVALGFALAAIAGCGNPRSLVRVYVDGDKPMADVTLTLKAMGAPADAVAMGEYPAVTVPMMGADQLRVGLYLPSGMHGSVVVHGVAVAGDCEIGVGEATASDVTSGAVVTINLTLKTESCVPVGDAGAGGTSGSGGAMGSGGATGTGGTSGSGGAGTGGAMGTGGTMGTGGAGTGGAMGSGGAGTGGVDGGPIDAPMDTPPDLTCIPEAVARACGQRCETDVRNNCGQLVHCGACTMPGEACGAAGFPNICAPCQDSRACRNVECGEVTDACGQMVNCGACLIGRDVCCAGHCVLQNRCPVAQ